MIRVQKLYKAFGDQPVLRGVDLEVATAEIMVVIGRSGGGKSVLLKHLIGLLRPDSGAILVDGEDITRLRGRALDGIRRALRGRVPGRGALRLDVRARERRVPAAGEDPRCPHAEIGAASRRSSSRWA